MAEQRSDEWRRQRLGRVTGSEIVNVMMTKDRAGYQNYLAQLVCERLTGRPTESFTSAAMQFGIDTEAQARVFYELTTGNDVKEVGFVEHPNLMAGSSPDGLIGDDGGLELKAPQPAQHIRNLTGAKIARNYALQIQWNMACTKRGWWDFASFNPDFPENLRLHVQRVKRDSNLIVEITSAVESFLKEVDALTEQLSKKA